MKKGDVVFAVDALRVSRRRRLEERGRFVINARAAPMQPQARPYVSRMMPVHHCPITLLSDLENTNHQSRTCLYILHSTKTPSVESWDTHLVVGSHPNGFWPNPDTLIGIERSELQIHDLLLHL